MTQTLTRFAEPELNAAFKRVQHSADWKGPINCTILESDSEEREKIRQAVEFYTATECVMRDLGGSTFWIASPGYRNGPAGP